MRVKLSKQPPPPPTASEVGPCPTVIQTVGHPGTGSLPSTIAPPNYPSDNNEGVGYFRGGVGELSFSCLLQIMRLLDSNSKIISVNLPSKHASPKMIISSFIISIMKNIGKFTSFMTMEQSDTSLMCHFFYPCVLCHYIQ